MMKISRHFKSANVILILVLLSFLLLFLASNVYAEEAVAEETTNLSESTANEDTANAGETAVGSDADVLADMTTKGMTAFEGDSAEKTNTVIEDDSAAQNTTAVAGNFTEKNTTAVAGNFTEKNTTAVASDFATANETASNDATKQVDDNPGEENEAEVAGNSESENDTPSPAPEPRKVEPGIERIYGTDRFGTAIAVAKELKDDLNLEKFDTVLISRGDQWKDALSGTYLASVKDAPILLVKSDKNEDVLNFIKENLAETGTLYILGGTQAVNEKLEQQLSKYGTIRRLSGATAIDTNLEILKEADSVSEVIDRDLLITTGKTYPDAISVSATGKPIMLVYDSLTNGQKAFMSRHLGEDSTIYIIGGENAVSKEIETQVIADYEKPVRISGANRYETSVAVAKEFFKDTEDVVIGRGDAFPDALAGGVLANARNVPLILSENNTGFQYAYNHIYKDKKIKAVTILGGEKALSDDTSAMNKKGAKRHGFLNIGSHLFFSDESGNLKKNTFFKSAEKEYAATSSGKIVKNGWAKVGKLHYYFDNYQVHSISKKAIAVLDKVGYTLSAAFRWAASLPYYTFPSSSNWGTIWFANYGFEKLRGDCIVHAATFYIMAKTLGYSITQVYGTVNIWYLPHSWTYIKHDDGTWIYDPNCYNETNYYAFKVKNGRALWSYHNDYVVMHM